MKIQENISLKEHTYYEIGGRAHFFIEAKNKREVKKSLRFAEKKGLSIFILGEGTNVLVADSGFDGLVIKIRNDKLRVRDSSKKGRKLIEAGAGEKLSEAVKLALQNNLKGLEWAVGIPGTIGGALRGNAGAFGGSMADIVKSTEVLLAQNFAEKEHGTNAEKGEGSAMFSDLKSVKFSASEMEFGYRSSKVKKEGGVIYKVVLGPLEQVEDGKMKEIKEEAREHMEYRNKNQPYDRPSCGSVFTNAKLTLNKAQKLHETLSRDISELRREDGKVVVPAGVLIEACGLKGEKVGGAQISKKHANFIVNLGESKAKHVRKLIQLAKERVKGEFGVDLECEVEMIGWH